jgi:hypothetical protein
MLKHFIVATALTLPIPALADVYIVDVTENPLNISGNRLADIQDIYTPPGFDLAELIVTFGPAIQPNPFAYDAFVTSVTYVPSVPEPGAFALVLLGFAGLFLRRAIPGYRAR